MQHQQGGAQYGGAPPPPELAPFPSSANPRPQFPGIPTGHPEAAAPISSRPPPAAQNFGELAAAAAAAGSFHDEDALAAGEDAERGGTPGNRWPREETLALLKIRSEMDAEFRDASLKGPLWENVSRKLGELGYIRSAKKCKEKFENVHKYYKRTKEGRAGRQDGKSYRFFSQLEALHTSPGGLNIGSGSGSNTPTSMSNPNPIPALPAPVTAAPPPTWANIQPPATAPTPTPFVTPPAATHATQGTMPISVPAAGISLSSDTFTSSSYDSDDDEDTEEGGGGPSTEGRKRKRGSGSGVPGGSRKMMAFFEGLMMQVMEKQEAMQQRFLETIEKREQERMVREEAWKRQEMARLNREHEILAQERAVAASRDSALIQFLQKIGGQPIHVLPPPPPAAAVIPAAPPPRPVPVVMPIPVTPPPRPVAVAAPAVPPPPPPPQQEPQKEPPPQQHQQQQILPQLPPPQQQPPHELHPAHPTSEIRNLPPSSCTELVPVPEQQELAVAAATPRGAFELGVSPSRWPKSEVHALIKLRSGLEPRYQEAGPKGPLWEEISLGMQRLGYNRSSKRCKEKWENINKYFKKVKESNKKRPEDAKTCPYFHQLDALYRKKNLASTSNAGYNIESNPQAAPLPLQAQPVQAPVPIQIQHETERKTGGDDNTGNQGGIQIQTSNGGLPPSFFEGGSSGGATINKPEDIMKELMEQQQRRQATMNHYGKLEESRNDHNMYDDEDDDDEDDEDDEDDKMVYKMQFERQNVGSGSGNGGGNASTKPAAATTAGSFLGMVQ